MQSAVSDSGTLVYIPGTSGASPIQRNLVWVDRHGKEELLSAQPNDYRMPRISPDGTRLALSLGATDIWIWDFLREAMTPLTRDAAADVSVIWTPDGKRVVFSSQRGTGNKIYWKAADGTGKVEPLASLADRALFPGSWSRDGNILTLNGTTTAGDTSRTDIWTLSLQAEKALKPLLQEDYSEMQPEISPDGRWMAYVSDESGRREIYVRPFPEVNKGKWPVSTSGGDNPLWSPDGLELYYRKDDSAMAVSVKTESTFTPGKPQKLFSGRYVTSLASGDIPPWDISRDGKRFLMIKPVEPTGKSTTAEAPHKINIVLNWTEELNKRVPAK
jgi:eukaryotic-like serine/threonine-protein kinase